MVAKEEIVGEITVKAKEGSKGERLKQRGWRGERLKTKRLKSKRLEGERLEGERLKGERLKGERLKTKLQ